MCMFHILFFFDGESFLSLQDVSPPVKQQQQQQYPLLVANKIRKKLTAPGIPRRSPIQVLTRPDLAYLIIIGLHRAFFYHVMAVLARDSDHHLSSIMLYLLLLLPSSFNTILLSY